MTIQELEKAELTEGIAYIIGLMFPKQHEFNNLESRVYIRAPIGHNASHITQDEITGHYSAVVDFLKDQNLINSVIIRPNKLGCVTVHRNEGFSILIEVTGNTPKQVSQILSKKVQEISNSSKNIVKYFIRGCFDGRSSIDKHSYYIALDVDSDYGRINLMSSILENYGLKVANNMRHDGEARAVQFRVSKQSIREYYDTVGFFSIRRNNDLKSILGL